MSTRVPVRARLLLAFEEGVPLTREAANKKAQVDDPNEIRHLIHGDFLRAAAWKPKCPREFVLAPRGIERREHYRAALALR